MSQYFPKPFEPFGGDINVKIYLSNYAAKAELKSTRGNDTSRLTLKSNLSNLKTEVGKVNADKLKTVRFDLSKLSNIVNDDVVQKNYV